MSAISVACLDMAGTTVRDDGLVLDAFGSAIAGRGLSEDGYAQAMKDVRASMGQSKIEVFRRVLGDEGAALDANEAFEKHYAAAVRAGEVAALPGAAEVMTAVRAAGIKVCLLTGFSPATRDALIDALDWRPLIDLALSPADAGRGRPWPDLPLTALLRLGAGAVTELAVAGDTPSDIESGVRAGAGIVGGVLTGAGRRADLEAAGATHVLDTVAGLLPLLGLLSGRLIRPAYPVGPNRSTLIRSTGIPASRSTAVAASANPDEPQMYPVASAGSGVGRSPGCSRPAGRGHDGGVRRVYTIVVWGPGSSSA
jgi:phosphonatase-like hydrolase